MKPRRRSTRKSTSRRRPASPGQIRGQRADDYLARQIEWSLALDAERGDVVYLLGLHLQMTEIEHLAESLKEFSGSERPCIFASAPLSKLPTRSAWICCKWPTNVD